MTDDKLNEAAMYFADDNTFQESSYDKQYDVIKSAFIAGTNWERERSKKLVEALRKISERDFRGNRPTECVIAYEALKEYEGKK